MIEQQKNIAIYQSADGKMQIDVHLQEQTIWLSLDQISSLFQKDKSTISRHIKNVFLSEELDKESVVANFATTAKDGKTYQVDYYNLDMIISLGYRVKSKVATNFRKWATERLKEYMIKGFTMDDERLKGNGGGNYWKELLARIKDIRSSEKVLYRQVLDLYATAVDYDPKDEKSIKFFKIVQNKLHYAITGKTAAELIYERVDSEKIHMGLTTWKNSPDGKIMKYDISIAKNYLNEEELRKLNNLTTFFLDYAESMAEEHQIMTMKNWIDETDNLLKFRKKEILQNAGTISHEQALEKANKEYEKFKVKQDKLYKSDFDNFLNETRMIENGSGNNG